MLGFVVLSNRIDQKLTIETIPEGIGDPGFSSISFSE